MFIIHYVCFTCGWHGPEWQLLEQDNETVCPHCYSANVEIEHY